MKGFLKVLWFFVLPVLGFLLIGFSLGDFGETHRDVQLALGGVASLLLVIGTIGFAYAERWDEHQKLQVEYDGLRTVVISVCKQGFEKLEEIGYPSTSSDDLMRQTAMMVAFRHPEKQNWTDLLQRLNALVILELAQRDSRVGTQEAEISRLESERRDMIHELKVTQRVIKAMEGQASCLQSLLLELCFDLFTSKVSKGGRADSDALSNADIRYWRMKTLLVLLDSTVEHTVKLRHDLGADMDSHQRTSSGIEETDLGQKLVQQVMANEQYRPMFEGVVDEMLANGLLVEDAERPWGPALVKWVKQRPAQTSKPEPESEATPA